MSKLPLHPLTIGKLLDIAKLVERVEGSELYTCFDPARLEDAKALFVWACGDGINKPSREDIHNRVLELTNPAKFAEQQAKEAQRREASADVGEATERHDLRKTL